MKLSPQEVRHIAALARVGMTDADVEKLREQLSNILENFEVLREVKTEGVQPTSHSIALESVLRNDQPGPSFSREEVLANAPRREEDFFRVRAILEE